MKKKILVISNSFPKPNRPQWGVFIAKTLESLDRKFDFEVINPVPWFPKWRAFSRFANWYEFAKIPSLWDYGNISVLYPRFFSFPKLSQPLQVILIVLSLLGLIIKLKKDSQISAILGFYLYPEGVVSVLIGKFLRVPVILSARGSDVNVEALHRWKHNQIKWALNNAQSVVGVSKDLCIKIEKIAGMQGPAVYIPNGIDWSCFGKLSRAAARKCLGCDHDKKILVFIGRLVEIKGLKYLLEALNILKRQGDLNFKTYLVGDGPERNRLEKHARDYGLIDSVVFSGMVGHEEVPVWMTAANLFCLPSLNEGLPNVVLEALACGTPVVASSVGGVPDLVKDGCGMLFPPGDSGTMAKIILQAMAKEWSRGDLINSVRDYSWESTGQKYETLIKSHFKTN